MIGIYKITNKLNGKSYIGQSIHCGKRLDEHCKGKQYIDNIIKEEGVENFNFEILKTIPDKKDELCYWEDYYIIKYNTYFPNGYNKRWNCNKNIRNNIKKEVFLDNSFEKIKKKESFLDLCLKYSEKIAHLYDYCVGILYTYGNKLEEITISLSELSNYIEESIEKTKIFLQILQKDEYLDMNIIDDNVNFVWIKDCHH